MVSVSNFLLPAWSDHMAKGPYDYLASLPRPFSVSPGGYEVVMTATGLARVFGEKVPGWKREQISGPASRAMRMRGAT